MDKPIILIVDDNKKNRDQVKAYISETHPECDFAEARNAGQALSLLHKELSPKLIVLDYHMPMKTGLELNREIKKCYGNFPTILWTGGINEKKVQEALANNEVDVCLPKNASLREFMEAVEKFL